jgi:hypothetical protein
VLAEVAPTIEENFPEAQSVQTEVVADEYLPASQSIQLEFSLTEYFPATQLEHVDAPGVEDFPKKHGMQTMSDVPLVTVEFLEAAQFKQALAPVVVTYCPRGQFMHDRAPKVSV